MNEYLTNLEKYAREYKIPVVLPNTREYLCNLCKTKQPKNILEIGMAIGFSASCMLDSCDANITCLEVSKPNILRAVETFSALGFSSRVEIIEGDCIKTLPTLLGREYDLIFLDGPKTQYVDMIDMILPLLSKDGIWVSDNVLFRGMVRDGAPISEPRFVRTARLLEDFLEKLESNPNLSTQVLHIGDGLSVVQYKR